MIFADKILLLRKKSGMSQEELADKLDISRQAVTKWETAQSVPDLSKIVKLSEIFGVSTDYLLKDEIEIVESVSEVEDDKRRKVTMEDANDFMKIRRESSLKIAFGTLLCIISPICLLMLCVLSDSKIYNITEDFSAGIGLCALIILVAIGVTLFILSYNKSKKYEYLETQLIDTEYGVIQLVKDRKEKFRGAYDKYNLIGTILCILSVIPLFISIIINSNNDLLVVASICALLLIVAIGVFCFIKVGVIWGSFERLLQEGDYTKQNKKSNTYVEPIMTIYWVIVTAIYLAISFLTNKWQQTWIVWVIAGVLSPAIVTLLKYFNKKK